MKALVLFWCYDGQNLSIHASHSAAISPFQQMNEPWQDVQWQRPTTHLPGQVVSDGANRRADSAREDHIHERQRNRQLQHDYRHDEGKNNDDDDEDEFSAYANSGTVKCENCNERYPTGLFQDHFRDCSRGSNG